MNIILSGWFKESVRYGQWEYPVENSNQVPLTLNILFTQRKVFTENVFSRIDLKISNLENLI